MTKEPIKAGKWTARECRLIYATARKVRKTILKEGNGDSTGFCGDASETIKARLQTLGIHGTVMRNASFGVEQVGINGLHAHCWLEHKGRIIDVTVDQFQFLTGKTRLPAVLIGQRFKGFYRYNNGKFMYIQ